MRYGPIIMILSLILLSGCTTYATLSFDRDKCFKCYGCDCDITISYAMEKGDYNLDQFEKGIFMSCISDAGDSWIVDGNKEIYNLDEAETKNIEKCLDLS